MSKTTSSDDFFKVEGTVVYMDLEGGFFIKTSDGGQIYDPINLPEAFQQDSLRVKILAKYMKDSMGFHMVGDVVEIIDISAQ